MAKKKHKLPLKAALKMGLSIKKPVRFGITVLLAAAAFGMTGLAILLGSYDEARAKVQTYVQFGDAISLNSTELLTYDDVTQLSLEWGLPCGSLSFAHAFYNCSEEAVNEMHTYMQQHRVHAVVQVDAVGCFDEEVLSGAGIELLAGKGGLAGHEVLISSCFANGLLSCGLAESAEGLIGQEIELVVPSPTAVVPSPTAVVIAGVYQNDSCVYAREYAATDGVFISYDSLCAGESYTGALFVSRDFFQTLTNYVDIGYFAGDGSAATGEKVRDFFDSHPEYHSELFQPFTELRERIEKITSAFGTAGGALAAFSVLMIFQFINLSIDGKRQMIGILRALGGRSADVLKIFLIESGFLGILSGALALALTAGIAPFCNTLISSTVGMNIAIIAYQPLVFIGVFAMCVAVSLLSALFPVLHEAKKLPVDVIKFAEE